MRLVPVLLCAASLSAAEDVAPLGGTLNGQPAATRPDATAQPPASTAEPAATLHPATVRSDAAQPAASWSEREDGHLPFGGTAHILLGTKRLKKRDWEQVEDQFAVGVNGLLTPAGFPLGGYLSVVHSSGSDTIDNGTVYSAVDASTLEFCVGPGFYQKMGPYVEVYAAAGLTLITATMQVDANDSFGSRTSDSDSGFATGGFAAGGIDVVFARHFCAGLNVGFSSANGELFGADIDFGGITIAAALGICR